MNVGQGLENGTIISSYKIIRLIATGGMGEVYEAYEERLNRKVAIKVILKEYLSDLDVLERFKVEGQTLAKVSHPNVVAVYSLDNFQDFPYLAMEYVEGVSLKVQLRKKAFSVKAALPLFKQLLLGAQALHESNIIHRDIKPDNIIYQKNKRVKIIDFGIAKMFEAEAEEITKAGVIIGSARYMSPEVASGASASKQSDIWSLGVIFYYMLTGETPFDGKSRQEIIEKVLNKKLSFSLAEKMWLPQDVKQIILRMCEKPLNKRYKNIESILRDLESYLQSSQAEKNKVVLEKLHLKNESQKDLEVETGFSIADNIANRSSSQHMPYGVGANSVSYTHGIDSNSNNTRLSLWKTTFVSALSIGLAWVSVNNWKSVVEKVDIVYALVRSNKADNKVTTEQVEAPPEMARPPVIQEIAKKQTLVKPQQPIVKKKKITKKKNRREVASPKKVIILNRSTNVVLKFNPTQRGRSPSSVAKTSSVPHLKWKTVRKAEAYKLQISSATNFKSVIVESSSVKGNEFYWKEAVPGKYYWRVRAQKKNGRSSLYSNTGKIKVSLSPPVLKRSFSSVHKIDSESQDNASQKVNINWPALPMASSYKVLVSPRADFKRGVQKYNSETNGISATLKKSGTYFVKVLALNSSSKAISNYSNTSKIYFSKTYTLKTPSLLTPNGTKIVKVSDKNIPSEAFTWKKVELAKSYEIEYSMDKKFKNVFYKKTVAKNQHLAKKIFPFGKIYWRVRSDRAGSKSTWSRPEQFVIPIP